VVKNGEKKTIQGKTHLHTLLRVVERDRFGRPALVQVLYDDTVESASEGDGYIAAYIPERALSKERVN
jgi:hypothetical protein